MERIVNYELISYTPGNLPLLMCQSTKAEHATLAYTTAATKLGELQKSQYLLCVKNIGEYPNRPIATIILNAAKITATGVVETLELSQAQNLLQKVKTDYALLKGRYHARAKS